VDTHIPDGSRRQRAALVAAPTLAVIARTMWTPFDDEEPAAYLDAVGEHVGRHDIGTGLMILSGLFLIPAIFALASAAKRRSPRLTLVATSLAVTGAVGMSAFSVIGIFASWFARQPDRAQMVGMWEDLITEPGGELLFLLILIGVLGFVLLGAALRRSGQPLVASAFVGLGGAATLFTTGGPVRALLIAAASIALAGFAWVATSLTAKADSPAARELAIANTPGISGATP
jgi:hypothetical protein